MVLELVLVVGKAVSCGARHAHTHCWRAAYLRDTDGGAHTAPKPLYPLVNRHDNTSARTRQVITLARTHGNLKPSEFFEWKQMGTRAPQNSSQAGNLMRVQ